MAIEPCSFSTLARGHLSSVSCHIFKVVPVLWEKLQRSGIERRTMGHGPPSQMKSAAASCEAGIVRQRLRPVRTISDHILASLRVQLYEEDDLES
ncbi:hypothetical protein CCUS01_14663 [Colletotrichum cuscutae]|uniref:Uncharacterized protein n=1 Tax=Colletotrichum cuscutae TaxID=1209917 RepID=A0AAI9Y8P5_9PEZI|nr:hypothetical protein CCUS01_14663 [Colletotrichum cuscutae]